VPAVVEEFYPKDDPVPADTARENQPTSLRGKLESQVARMASG